MKTRLFVYGTLLFPEIQFALLNKQIEGIPAILNGYKAVTTSYGIFNSDYPILKESINDKVDGMVLSSISKKDMEIIKFFEGSTFKLHTLCVLIEGVEEMLSTFVHNGIGNIEYGPEWDKDVFSVEHLDLYISTIIPQILQEYRTMYKGENK